MSCDQLGKEPSLLRGGRFDRSKQGRSASSGNQLQGGVASWAGKQGLAAGAVLEGEGSDRGGTPGRGAKGGHRPGAGRGGESGPGPPPTPRGRYLFPENMGPRIT